jgi:hypothetical protein
VHICAHPNASTLTRFRVFRVLRFFACSQDFRSRAGNSGGGLAEEIGEAMQPGPKVGGYALVDSDAEEESADPMGTKDAADAAEDEKDEAAMAAAGAAAAAAAAAVAVAARAPSPAPVAVAPSAAAAAAPGADAPASPPLAASGSRPRVHHARVFSDASDGGLGDIGALCAASSSGNGPPRRRFSAADLLELDALGGDASHSAGTDSTPGAPSATLPIPDWPKGMRLVLESDVSASLEALVEAVWSDAAAADGGFAKSVFAARGETEVHITPWGAAGAGGFQRDVTFRCVPARSACCAHMHPHPHPHLHPHVDPF